MENSLVVFYKLNKYVFYDLVVVFLGIYLKEIKIKVYINVCWRILIVILFRIVLNWKII